MEIKNWSSTHSVTTKAYLQPGSAEEVENIIREAHRERTQVRDVRNALSPNGIGLSEDTIMSLGQCDRVLRVDQERKTVTIEAGACVHQVADALTTHGLTLQNYTAINVQQLGGLLQVGAHGTGATIPPVDEHVVAMKLVTPQLGTIEPNNEHNPELFRMTKVGLGAMGAVTEVTIKCVARHELQETASVMTRAEVKANHHALLRDNKHPSANVASGQAITSQQDADRSYEEKPSEPRAAVLLAAALHDEDCLEPLKSLLLRKLGPGASAADSEGIDSLNFAGLRETLLEEAPLDVEWIKQVNVAKAEFWRRSQGTRVDYSDKVLSYERGGQQWVNEVCFSVGTLKAPNGKDLDYMIFSWVGLIMYPSAEDSEARKRVTDAFLAYRDLCKTRLWDRFPISEFNAVRALLDPRNIMANDFIDICLGSQ